MRMTLSTVVLVATVLALSGNGWAQQPPTPQPQPQPPPQPMQTQANVVPLKLDVVLVKYKDDKRVGSTPYSMTVNTGGKASIRMGAEVPIPTMTTPTTGPVQIQPPQPLQYKLVGTNIDCYAAAVDGRTFRINLTIEDTSVYANADAPGTVAGAPTLRTFKASNDLLLRDGASAEFVAATDKVSGEVIKAEVKLTVIK